MGNNCVAGGGAPTRADITVSEGKITCHRHFQDEEACDIVTINGSYASDKDNIDQVVNNTKYKLVLNPVEKCGRECACFGWQVFFYGNVKDSLVVIDRSYLPDPLFLIDNQKFR